MAGGLFRLRWFPDYCRVPGRLSLWPLPVGQVLLLVQGLVQLQNYAILQEGDMQKLIHNAGI